MPYANLWDETSPAGSSAANALDTDITDDKKATRERLNSLIGVATTTPLADPVIPSSNSLATLRSELTAAQAAITTLNTLQTYVKTIPAIAYSALNLTTGAAFPNLFSPNISLIGLGLGRQNYANSGQLFGYIHIDIPVGAIITEVRSYWYSTGTATANDYLWASNLSGTIVDSYISAALTNAGYQNRVHGNNSIVYPYTVPSGYALVHQFDLGNTDTTSAFVGLKITYTSANPNIRI